MRGGGGGLGEFIHHPPCLACPWWVHGGGVEAWSSSYPVGQGGGGVKAWSSSIVLGGTGQGCVNQIRVVMAWLLVGWLFGLVGQGGEGGEGWGNSHTQPTRLTLNK